MSGIGRREVLLSAAAFAAMGCSDAGGGAISSEDMALGSADAPVTMIEYASVTCPHCAAFHEAMWERLNTEYIDTGKVRYVLREFPTSAPPIAVAGYQLARCNGASVEQYFDRVDVLYQQQQAIFATGSMAGARDKLIEIGAAAGLSRDQVMACMTDEAGAARIRATVEAAQRDFQITGTPTVILNGRKMTDPSVLTWDGLKRELDAALAAG